MSSSAPLPERRFDVFLDDYMRTRRDTTQILDEMRSGLVRIETKMTFYQEEYNEINERLVKLETFKSTVMGLIIAASFAGGLFGIFLERVVLS